MVIVVIKINHARKFAHSHMYVWEQCYMSWPLLLFKQKLTFTLNASFFPPFFWAGYMGRMMGLDLISCPCYGTLNYLVLHVGFT